MNYRKHPEDIDFQKYWQILKRHKVPATRVFLVTVVLATIGAFISEKKYEAYGKLKFIKENTTSALIAETGEKLGKLETFRNTATPVDTEAEVIRSAPVIQEVIKELNLTNKKGKSISYEDFLKNLTVKNIPGTDILTVAYQSPDREEAQAIVNTTIETYIKKNIAINRNQAQAAREFIGQQLPKTEAELQAAEERLRIFKEQNEIVNLDVETELAANKIGQLDEQIDLTQAQLEKVNSQISGIEQKLNIKSEEALSLNTINDSSSVQQIFTKLKQVQDKLAVERSRFQENSPIISSLKAEKTELETELQTRAQQSLDSGALLSRQVFQTGDIQKQLAEKLISGEVQRQSLGKELAFLEQSKAFYQQKNNLMPQLQQQYQDLLRKVEIKQRAYTTLLSNLQQVQIAENQNVGNAQIVSRAVAGKYPVSINRTLIVVAGIGIGSILYIITAFLLDLKDPSFKTAKELRESLDYKLLSMIPNLNQQGFLGWTTSSTVLPERQTTEAPHSLASEAYKMLYTNLQFLATNQDIRVITVTSSIPQEGKSTVSANLAGAIAQLGQKVLLIDADLHKSKQHSIWDLNSNIGIIEVLQGQVQPSKAIQSVSSHPNLNLLTFGSTETECLSLLQSNKMVQLLDWARENYDLVIIDTPPILIFADALSVSRNTDGIVLVGRIGTSNPNTARYAKELLEQSGQKILGLVVNGTNDESENYYQYAKDYYQSDTHQRKLLPLSKS